VKRAAAGLGPWVLGLLILAAGPALAHPYDEVVQGAYLTLAPGQVRLELDLTPGPAVAGALLKALDPDNDQRVTAPEARAYAQQVLNQSSLVLDGAPARWRVERVETPDYASLKLQSDTLKIYAVADRPDRPGPHTLGYDNRYQPAKSQCIANVFLQPGGGWRYAVTGQKHSPDGRSLTVAFTGSRG
jgi:hypothetical protein